MKALQHIATAKAARGSRIRRPEIELVLKERKERRPAGHNNSTRCPWCLTRLRFTDDDVADRVIAAHAQWDCDLAPPQPGEVGIPIRDHGHRREDRKRPYKRKTDDKITTMWRRAQGATV